MTSRRSELYDQLSEVLGIDHARTLMSYLPDESPATRNDIAELRTEVKSDMADLRADMAALRTELKTDITELRTEVKDGMSELRTEIRHLHDRLHRMSDSLAAQTRTFVVASLGSAVTVAGFVFIAVQLV